MKKIVKTSATILLTLATAICPITNATAKTTTPHLNKKSITLSVGNKKRLKVIGKKKVTWKSSNTKIATVTKKGVVQAIAKGKATITAKLKSGKKLKCSVKVRSAFVYPWNPKKIKAYAKKYAESIGMEWLYEWTENYDSPLPTSSFDTEKELKGVIESEIRKCKRIQEQNGYIEGEDTFYIQLTMKKTKTNGKKDYLMYFVMG